MKKTIMIDGLPVEMKCTGATPSFYRELFKRDLFIEFAKLGQYYTKDENGEYKLSSYDIDLSVIENLAYTMAYQAKRDIGTKMEWLDQFEHSTAVINAMKDIIDFYMEGLVTTSEVKKKTSEKQTDR